MKKNLGSLLILAALLASVTRSPAPSYTLDPVTTINDYLVSSEFSTPTPGGGAFYDALFTFGDPALVIASGKLTGTTTTADPNMLLFPQWPWTGLNPKNYVGRAK